MNLGAQEVATISVIGSFLSLGSVAYLAGVKLTALQVKVDTMWDFLLRRGKSEAVLGGWAEMNSPIVIKDEGRRAVAAFVEPAKKLRASIKPPPTDAEFMMALERQLGERILEQICIPQRMHMGACLFLLCEAVKESELPEAA